MQYRSTAEWLELFQENVKNVYQIELDNHVLSESERDMILNSIQDFQLGESSEGHTLRKNAKKFSEKYGISEYVPLMNLFIAEENRHSVYLGRFMKQHKIPRKRQTFNDSVFRFLRKLIGIETSVRTLVTAEIIALSYYQCLALATESQVLKGVCGHMLLEEEDHVHFQMQHIQFINLQKNTLLRRMCDALHRVLLNGALCTVWLHHRKVLKTKFSFIKFICHANQEYSRVLEAGTKLGQKMLKAWKGEVEYVC